jgi:hypothetical protein
MASAEIFSRIDLGPGKSSMEWTLMILSRKSDYGLRAALELARLYDARLLSAQRIAERHQLPIAFVKKLL